MKNKPKLSLYSFLIIFAVNFSIMILLFSALSLFVGLDVMLNLKDFILIIVLSIISSLAIFIILLFEKINQVLQIDLVYFILNLFVYLMCFITKIYQNRIGLFLISMAISIIGLIFITLITNYFNKKENDSLNDSLLKYKERD